MLLDYELSKLKFVPRDLREGKKKRIMNFLSMQTEIYCVCRAYIFFLCYNHITSETFLNDHVVM